MPVAFSATNAKAEALEIFCLTIRTFFGPSTSDEEKQAIYEHLNWLSRQPGTLICDAMIKVDATTARTGLSLILSFQQAEKLSS